MFGVMEWLKPRDKNAEKVKRKYVRKISHEIDAFRKKAKGQKNTSIDSLKSFLQEQPPQKIPDNLVAEFEQIIYDVKLNWSNNSLKEIAEFENIGVQGPAWFLRLNEPKRAFMIDFIGTRSYSPNSVKKFINYFGMSETKCHQFLRWYEYNIKLDGFKFSSTEVVDIGEFSEVLDLRHRSDHEFRNGLYYEADSEDITNDSMQVEDIEESYLDMVSKLINNFCSENYTGLVFICIVYTIYFIIYLMSFYLLSYNQDFFLAIRF
jgi:hypothetical protein